MLGRHSRCSRRLDFPGLGKNGGIVLCRRWIDHRFDRRVTRYRFRRRLFHHNRILHQSLARLRRRRNRGLMRSGTRRLVCRRPTLV